MEKIQVSLSKPTVKEMQSVMEEEGFETESEFGRHVIQEWLTLRKFGLLKPGGINLNTRTRQATS